MKKKITKLKHYLPLRTKRYFHLFLEHLHESLFFHVDIDDATYDYLLSELKERLKPEQIELDIEECKLRAKPWNSYHRLDKFPRAVVYPETTEDVSFVVKTCNKYRIPIIPFGGGTSIEGQTLVS